MTHPKLHLRDLFWLVLVAGMGCAWWVEFKRSRTIDATASEITQLVQEFENDPPAVRGIDIAVVGLGGKTIYVTVSRKPPD